MNKAPPGFARMVLETVLFCAVLGLLFLLLLIGE